MVFCHDIKVSWWIFSKAIQLAWQSNALPFVAFTSRCPIFSMIVGERVGDRAESAHKTFLVSFTYWHELLIQTEDNSIGSKGDLLAFQILSKGPCISLLAITTFPILSSDWFPRNFTDSLTAVQCPLKGQYTGLTFLDPVQSVIVAFFFSFSPPFLQPSRGYMPGGYR